MGFRARRSFKVSKGVRVNLTKTGIGMSVGGRGMRYSVHSSGRRTASVGLPGTGLGYVATKGGGRTRSMAGSAAPIFKENKPGLFASRAEKELFKIIKSGMDIDALDRAADLYPSHHYVAIALAAVKRIENKREPDIALAQVHKVLRSGYNPETDEFAKRYLPFVAIKVGLPTFSVTRLPYSKVMLALGASSILLKQGKQDEALEFANYLQSSVGGRIVLVELYNQCDQPEKTVELTDGLSNDDDASMLLLVQRGRALAKMGYPDAASEAFKEALRYRSRPTELKQFAWFNRARAYLEANKRSQARKDLERIMAENSNYPGLEELMQQLK